MKRRILISRVLMLLLIAPLMYASQPGMISVSGLTHQKHSVTCVDCHNTNKPVAKASTSACLKCHSNGKGKYVGTGAKKYAFDGHTTKEVNPHQPHFVELPCTECHKTHVASVNYCNKCHLFSDMPVK